MFKRFIRAIKSMFGGMVSSIEDPKLILEQNIRELNDQIPQMNENIATVKANAVMLRKEVERYERLLSELTSKIKAAINADRDEDRKSTRLNSSHVAISYADFRLKKKK